MQTNLARLAEEALARHGDHDSLFFEGSWHTSAGLSERAARVGAGLVAAGVEPGDRVAVFMANCPEVVVVYEGVWRAGGAVTPIIFLVTAPELAHILTDSGAVAVVTTPELLPRVKEALDGRELPVYLVGGNFAELEATDPGPVVDRAPHELAALLYTGGTTGRSKAVALSHENLSNAGASSRSVSHVMGLTRGIGALPLSHSFGILVTVGNLHAPEPLSTVLQRWFEPGEWLRLAAEHKAQVSAVVPSMLAILLGHPLEQYDLSSLRYVFSGAAPLPPAVAAEFQRRVPSVTVLEGYGCTETGGIISGTPPLHPKPGTVGKAVPNVQIRIVRADGSDAPAGDDGEIVVRGPNVMSGYWGSPALPGGWFPTGDVGRLDADGYLSIVDRIKDLIIRGGYNVYPRDVEDVLMTHPAVAMAAVVGRPDPRLGEEVVAFVSLATGAEATPDELVAYARARLAAHKYPRDIRIVDAIPLTSVGKLDRKRLRATVTG